MLTDNQYKALLALRSALKKCSNTGLAIIGFDSELMLFRKERHSELLLKYNGDQYKAIMHHLNQDECPTIDSPAYLDSMGL